MRLPSVRGKRLLISRTGRCRVVAVAVSALLVSLVLASPTLAQGATGGLSVTLAGSNLSPHVGEPFTYIVRVTNRGSAPATGVVLQIAFPPSFGDHGVLPPPGCSAAPLLPGMTCALGTLAAGQTRELAFAGYFSADGTATSTATVKGVGTDPPGDNSATLIVEVEDDEDGDDSDDDDGGGRRGGRGGGGGGGGGPSAADLAITQTDSPDPAVVGGCEGSLQLTAVVQNLGPNSAADVSVTFVVTNGSICGVSSSSSTLTCTFSSGPISTAECAIGAVGSGNTEIVTAGVAPTAPGTTSSTVTVTSTTPDPNSSNNSDTDATTVIASTTTTFGPLGATCRAESSQDEAGLPFFCEEALPPRAGDGQECPGDEEATEGDEDGTEGTGEEPDGGDSASGSDGEECPVDEEADEGEGTGDGASSGEGETEVTGDEPDGGDDPDGSDDEGKADEQSKGQDDDSKGQDDDSKGKDD
jgi:uncharacterized repeat protein (TIGR01451 family)